ncbi:integrase core domain-containing protein [Marinisporobacter balticus]|uniref:Transposase n=1 Tax=Marinisporobacter balticus TaxID=2018667 RepID=A0A4R2K904_9FIRM|nr:transposase [Marinisporobacter balticus]
MKKRRSFTPEFKTQVVLELLREEKELNQLATEHEIAPNMLRNWKKEDDNVIVERFFRTLKYDAIYIYHYVTPKELRAGINRFMKLYNKEHPHQAHNYQTPYEVYYGFKKVA